MLIVKFPSLLHELGRLNFVCDRNSITGVIMISQIEGQLTSASELSKGSRMSDVTLQMQFMFNDADRIISKARLSYNGPGSSAWLVVIIGLRSEILTPFSKFDERKSDRYMPCDIPAIVPGLALMSSMQNHGLAVSAIARNSITRFVLVFEGVPERTGGSMKSLSTAIWNFFKRWTDYTEVLMGTLNRDPVVGFWEIDWREFLAGETGFVQMPWFSPMSYSDRELGLNRIIASSKALLASILNRKQLQDPLIIGLKDWLDCLKPLHEVVVGVQVSEEVEI
jgi:hypothetical protein